VLARTHAPYHEALRISQFSSVALAAPLSEKTGTIKCNDNRSKTPCAKAVAAIDAPLNLLDEAGPKTG